MQYETKNTALRNEARSLNAQRTIDNYVSNCFLNSYEGNKCRNYTHVDERQYRHIDDIRKSICAKIDTGGYTDAVSYDRVRSTKECLPKSKIIPSNFSTGNDLNALAQCGVGHEPVVFATDPMKTHSIDEAASQLDREVASMEFYESILLSTKRHSLGAVNKKNQLVKLFEYVNNCNASGTIVALLNIIQVVDYSVETVIGIERSNGIAILLNLLNSEVTRVQKVAVKVLLKLCQLLYFGRIVIGLGGLPTLSNLLTVRSEGLNFQVVQLLSLLAFLNETRCIAYRSRLIVELVCLLGSLIAELEQRATIQPTEVPSALNDLESNKKHINFFQDINNAISYSVRTLGRLATNRDNVELMRKAGVMPLLLNLVEIKNTEILVPTFDLLTHCMKEKINRKTFIDDKLLTIFIKASEHVDLNVRVSSGSVLSACLVEPAIRDELLRRNGFVSFFTGIQAEMEKISSILSSSWLNEDLNEFKVPSRSIKAISGNELQNIKYPSPNDNRREGSISLHTNDQNVPHFHLLRSFLEALSAFMQEKKYADKLVELGLTQLLVNILSVLAPYIVTHTQPSCCVSSMVLKLQKLEQLVACTLECLSQVCLYPVAQDAANEEHGLIDNLVNFLSLWNSPVLEPCIGTITSMSTHQGLLKKLLDVHIFRITFSLSLHESPRIRAAALRATACICRSAPNKVAVLRPISGSLHKFVGMIRDTMKSIETVENAQRKIILETVLQWAFAFVAEMGQTEVYRQIMVDLGIAPMLIAHLRHADTVDSRIALVQALQYSSAGLIKCAGNLTEYDLLTLFLFLRPPHVELQRAAGQVIYALNSHPPTAARMKELGMSKLILQMLGSGIKELQLAAATTVCKMNLKFKKKESPPEEYAKPPEPVEEEEEEGGDDYSR